MSKSSKSASSIDAAEVWYDKHGNPVANEDFDFAKLEQQLARVKAKSKTFQWSRVIPIRVMAPENINIRSIEEDMEQLKQDYEIQNVFDTNRWSLLFDPAVYKAK